MPVQPDGRPADLLAMWVRGSTYRVMHARRGQFDGKLVAQTGEWLTFRLLTPVETHSRDYAVGEDMVARKCLCDVIMELRG